MRFSKDELDALAREGQRQIAAGRAGVPARVVTRTRPWFDPESDGRLEAVFVGVSDLTESQLRKDLDLLSIITGSHYRDQEDTAALILAMNVRVPDAVAKALRESIAEEGQRGASGAKRPRFAVLQQWWSVSGAFDFDVPRPLRGAAALASAENLERLSPVATAQRGQEEACLDRHGLRDDPMWIAASYLAKASAISQTWIPQRDLQLAAVREALSELVSSNADALLEDLAWLLCGPDVLYVDFAAELCVRARGGFTALARLAKSSLDPEIGLSARGLLSQLRGGTMSNSGDLARWSSDNSTFLIPAPLSAPTSIWCDAAPFEDLLRSTITAVAEKVRTASLSKEDQVTGGLLTLLADRLAVVRGHAPRHSERGALRLLDVAITGPDEKNNGADLAITVDVDIPGRLRITKAHLVQAKRAPRKTAAIAPEWKIEVDQLEKLISHDPTATYWLYCEKPGQRVLCVPATYLQAIVAAREANLGRRIKTCKVAYGQDLRSAAIPLGQLMTDLLIGLWVGTTAPNVLKIAAGSDRAYMPRAHLDLRIGVTGAD